jgi:hypothetical protein
MSLIINDVNNLIIEAEKSVIEFKLDKAIAKTEKAYSL